MKKNLKLQTFATWYMYAFAVYMALIVLPTFWGYYMYSPLNTYWVIIPVWIIGVILFWFARIRWYGKIIVTLIWILFTFYGVFLGLGANMRFLSNCQTGVGEYSAPVIMGEYTYKDSNIYI
jgi:hypothetical protein